MPVCVSDVCVREMCACMCVRDRNVCMFMSVCMLVHMFMMCLYKHVCVLLVITLHTIPSSLQGQLNISVQELDGFYTHTVQVEELSTTFELPSHSKIRK